MHAITEVTIAVLLADLLHELAIPIDRVIKATAKIGRLTRAARLAKEQWLAN